MEHECHETGRVTRVLPNQQVEVVIDRAKACGSCAAKGSCASMGGPTKELRLVVHNAVDARVGDMVTLTMDESRVISASAVLYLLPALALLAGAIVGRFLLPQAAISPDAGTFIGALIGLAAGFLGTSLLGRRMTRSSRYQPRLTGVASPGGERH